LKKLVVALLCAACAVTVLAVPSGSSATGHAQVAKKCKKSKKAVVAKKKCKKKAPAPAPTIPPPTATTPTGPTEPTGPDPNDGDGDGVSNATDNCPANSNPGQEDSDGDDKGDACDPCPDDTNPGTVGCPTTIYAINDGTQASGSYVRISNALVTAKMGDGSAIWVQIKSTDVPDTTGSTAYAGLEVSTTGVSLAGINVGSRVTIDGTSGTHSLTAAQIAVVGTDAIEYGGATAANFANGSVEDALNGQFVNITSSTTLSSISGTGEWVTAAGFTVGKRIIGTLPACATGTSLSLFGIADLVASDLVLLPRSTADLGAPCLTDLEVAGPFGTTCVGDVTQGSVTLSAPAVGATAVSLTSSDPTNVPVPAQVVVPDASTTGSFSFTPTAEVTATITATLQGGQKQDSVSAFTFCG
jgi:hypothetical protein